MKLSGRLRSIAVRAASKLFDVYARKSYSQEGEDLVLGRMFPGITRGFYVDVGAHHPRRFSNTYAFYKKGWSGINIEPNPDVVSLFKLERARDRNLQLGVSDAADILRYYVFDEPALNTFDRSLMQWRIANTPYKVVKTIEIAVEPLADILRRELPPRQSIDFMSIDVEGKDFAVLQSNDWAAFRPKCILVEAMATSVEADLGSELCSFMKERNYILFCKTFNTLFFRERSFHEEMIVAAGPQA